MSTSCRSPVARYAGRQITDECCARLDTVPGDGTHQRVVAFQREQRFYRCSDGTP
ncbi:hypothetical protein KCP70_11220 [Salmonella enterica subsp. enterica]|nr:hypothetical protein KCP70_11220 [Salmonella enterica subsp. enterica]